ncbi:MAG: hypothetical protein FJ207_03970 [Gemmatimonadetes bacterium]|nr:hypothetical protein [Gemmatimonadota bacterium]
MSRMEGRVGAILEYLTGRRRSMFDLLVELASHEPPSDVKESQVAVQASLIRALTERGFAVRLARRAPAELLMETEASG